MVRISEGAALRWRRRRRAGVHVQVPGVAVALGGTFVGRGRGRRLLLRLRDGPSAGRRGIVGGLAAEARTRDGPVGGH